jgi:hypothetical protein
LCARLGSPNERIIMNTLEGALADLVTTGIINAVEDPADRITLLEDVIEVLESVLATWDEAATP